MPAARQAHKMLASTLLCVSLIGCSGPAVRPAQDGPPIAGPAGLDTIPDAVPRAEPLSRYGNMTSYKVRGKRYFVLPDSTGYKKRGLASWYGKMFHGRRTSSGETYDMYAMTAAHRTLPLPTYVRVTNLDNGRNIIVRVNDRGPFHNNRIIDLSYTAAVKLDMIRKGTARVEVVALDPSKPPEPKKPVPLTVEPELRPIPAATAEEALSRLFLQAGAFGNRSNAQRLKQRLDADGFENVRLHQASANSLHRVRLGPYSSFADMQSDRERLLAKGITAQVVSGQ